MTCRKLPSWLSEGTRVQSKVCPLPEPTAPHCLSQHLYGPPGFPRTHTKICGLAPHLVYHNYSFGIQLFSFTFLEISPNLYAFIKHFFCT